jgi:hypothetical protein
LRWHDQFQLANESNGGRQFLPESPRPQRPRTESDGPSGIATGPNKTRFTRSIRQANSVLARTVLWPGFACRAVTTLPWVRRAPIGALLAVLACAPLLWSSWRHLRSFGKLVSELALNALRQSDAC